MKQPKPLPSEDLQSVLTQTAPLWEEVREQRLFVTGGTGFFGRWLMESFCFINDALDLGAQMVVLTRDTKRFAEQCPHLAGNPAVAFHVGDVRSFEFPDGDFTFVIHAATDTSARAVRGNPKETLSTIAGGTERALELATTHGTRKFLLTSSGAVYGKQPPELTHVPESFAGAPDPLDPASVYGEGKRVAELLCALYSEPGQLACKIARCWAFCGPHLPLDQHFAIGNFIGDVLAGRPIRILGDGTPRRSYLYAADLAVWLWTILFKAPALEPFNVGSSHDMSIAEIAKAVSATLNPDAEILISQGPDRITPQSRYVPCVDRAESVLGLKETVPLAESILRTARWHGFSKLPSPN